MLLPRPAYYSWQMVIRYLNDVEHAALAHNDRVNVVRLRHTNDRQTLVMWSRSEATTQVEITATSDKAYLLDQYGNRIIIRPQNGIYNLTLPGARCDEEDGCAVGGSVSLLIQPDDDITLREITSQDRIALEFN